MSQLVNERSARHVEAAKGYFDDLAGGWSQRYADDPAMYARSERFYAGLSCYQEIGRRVLDFGCGSGLIAQYLSKKGFVVTGIDVSPEMVEQANSVCDIAGPAFLVYGGSGQLPFKSQSYDAVISSSVLEYLPNPMETLKEFRRILKSGGTLLFTVPDMRNSFRKKERLKRILMLFPPFRYFLKKSRWNEGMEYLRLSCNRFSIEKWQRVLVESGFESFPAPDEQGPLVMIAARAK